MKLLVQLPIMTTRIYGKYRNRIFHEESTAPLLTMVHALRRIPRGDGFDQVTIEADAYVPPGMRVDVPQRDRWVSDGVLRVQVLIGLNRKSLAPFIDSGDPEWDLRPPANSNDV